MVAHFAPHLCCPPLADICCSLRLRDPAHGQSFVFELRVCLASLGTMELLLASRGFWATPLVVFPSYCGTPLASHVDWTTQGLVTPVLLYGAA